MSAHIKPSPARSSVPFVIRWLVLCGAVAASSVTHAQSTVNELPRRNSASADPNTPAFGLSYRGSIRAQLGAALPLWIDPHDAGAIVTLSPLLELHEPAHSPQALPSEYWRARVALSAGAFWTRDQEIYLVALALEHESDHETAHAYSHPGFLALNALALQALGNLQLGAWVLRVAPSARWYALSCTRDRSVCKNFAGDSAFGAQLDATLEAPGLAWFELWPFVSASGFGIVPLAAERGEMPLAAERGEMPLAAERGEMPHAAVRGESHLEVHVGLLHDTRFLLMQLFALGYFGNDVGITRGTRVVELGVGTRLAL